MFFDDLLPKIRSNQDENIHHVVVPNATHDVMMDAPGATAQFTAEFLRRHDLPIRNI
ncbi:hypothetical protein ACFC25_13355 [Pseudarthrobacter sp. NPDC055928]|uniref:hypothetical protein n=1 Tax=Pseudarthrobacter sp. NPDC055928 TaxID=3345661 RepID=UPI0035DB7C20